MLEVCMFKMNCLLTFSDTHGFIPPTQPLERLATMKKEALAALKGREGTQERAEVKFSKARNFEAFVFVCCTSNFEVVAIH